MNNKSARLAILEDVLNILAAQPEIDRHRNDSGKRRRCIDSQPLDAIVGENADAIALAQPDPRKRIGEPAGALIPQPKRHAAFKVARADLFRTETPIRRQHVADVSQLTHRCIAQRCIAPTSLWWRGRWAKPSPSDARTRMTQPVPLPVDPR